VSIDEATDASGRKVANVVIGVLKKTIKPYQRNHFFCQAKKCLQ
jgi:hypothetical protein